MNPRGKHFIDAVDPDENSQENTSQQLVSDVAEPASTTVDRLIEKAPEFADRLMSLLGEKSGAEG